MSDKRFNYSLRQVHQNYDFSQARKSKFAMLVMGPVSLIVNELKILTCVQSQTKWVTLKCNKRWTRGNYSKKGNG